MAKYVILGEFSALMIIVGCFTGRKIKTADDFVHDGRRMGPWLLSMAYDTTCISAVVPTELCRAIGVTSIREVDPADTWKVQEIVAEEMDRKGVSVEEVEALRWAHLLHHGGTMLVNTLRIIPLAVAMDKAVYPENIIGSLRDGSLPGYSG